MYTHAINETHAVLLGIYSGAKEASDIERCVESMQRTDRIALAQKRGALFVVVPDPQYPSPNSQDRQRFAALKESCRAGPSLFVLVTRSSLLRGVITAVSWLSPNTEQWRAVACESFFEAMARAEEFRAESAEALRAMDRGLRAALPMRRVG
jgi:hypothetical protein